MRRRKNLYKQPDQSQTIQISDDQLSQSGPRRSVLDQSACNGVHDSVIFTSAYWAFQCDRCHRKLGSSNQTHITDTLNPLQGSNIADVTEKQTQSRPTSYISAILRDGFKYTSHWIPLLGGTHCTHQSLNRQKCWWVYGFFTNVSGGVEISPYLLPFWPF